MQAEHREVELRKYWAVIRRWLWLIVLLAVLAGGTVLVYSPSYSPGYEAVAKVAIVRSKEEVTFEAFTIMSQADLLASAQDLTMTLTAMVKSRAIASQVIEELDLAYTEEVLLRRVTAVADEPPGNLISIAVTAASPQLAADIANAWARVYAEHANRLYGESSVDLAALQSKVDETRGTYQEAEEALAVFVGHNRIAEFSREIQAKQELIESYKDAQIATQTQAVEAKRRYDQAEEVLAQFLGDNRLDELDRETKAKRGLIASYKDAWITAQTQAAEAKRRYDQAEEVLAQFLGDNRLDELSREIEARQITVAGYYATKRQLDELVADARALRDQLREGATPSSALRDSLSLLFLRVLRGEPVQLQFSFEQLSGPAEDPAQQLSELDAFIANLEARRTVTQELIDDSPLQQEILQLQQQLEQEQAAKEEPTQARDLAWKTYETHASELARLDVLASDPSGRLIDQYSQEVLQLQEQLEREQARERELVSVRDMAWGAYQTQAHELARLDVLASDPSSRLVEQYSQEVLQLQEQLAREQARERELVSVREMAWEIYQSLTRRAFEVTATSGIEKTLARLAVPAVAPRQPTTLPDSRLLNILLASAVGAMLGVGVAFLIEYLDDTIRTLEDVRRALGVAPLGGIAPQPAHVEGGPVALTKPRSPQAESFWALRTQLELVTEGPLGTLLVTSPNPLEGRSTITANLGVVMAQAGRSVIVVDSDMRHPILHEMFQLPNTKGLSNVLSEGDFAFEEYLQGTEVEGLRVLTSGPLPPNPSGLLGSPRLGELIQRLKGEADVLLFDSPAALAVTDAAMLAEQMDGVLLVAEAGSTRRGTAQQAIESLTKVGANLIGVALNRLALQGAAEYYYESEQGGVRRRRGNVGRWAASVPLLESVVKRFGGFRG